MLLAGRLVKSSTYRQVHRWWRSYPKVSTSIARKQENIFTIKINQNMTTYLKLMVQLPYTIKPTNAGYIQTRNKALTFLFRFTIGSHLEISFVVASYTIVRSIWNVKQLIIKLLCRCYFNSGWVCVCVHMIFKPLSNH